MVLTTFKWISSLVYIDDVGIYYNNIEEHIHHAEKSLATLAEAGLTFKMNKCPLFSDKVE